MTTRLYLYSTDHGWELQRLYNTAEFSERLDEELDTGNVQTITSSSVSFEDCCMARLTIADTFSQSIEGYFCGFDMVEKRGGGYFIHSLDLCEPTRLLMGVFIDGRRITQPLEETQKKKLYEVAKELLTTCETLEENETERFAFEEGSEPVALMRKLVAPEFHWGAGASLWECLCDIANVINCIPRLVVNEEKTAFSVIVFDKVNEIPQTITADWGGIEGEGTGNGETETPEENPDSGNTGGDNETTDSETPEEQPSYGDTETSTDCGLHEKMETDTGLYPVYDSGLPVYVGTDFVGEDTSYMDESGHYFCFYNTDDSYFIYNQYDQKFNCPLGYTWQAWIDTLSWIETDGNGNEWHLLSSNGEWKIGIVNGYVCLTYGDLIYNTYAKESDAIGNMVYCLYVA